MTRNYVTLAERVPGNASEALVALAEGMRAQAGGPRSGGPVAPAHPRAEGSADGVVFVGAAGAFEELVGYVASEANAETDRRRMRLLDEACAALDAAVGLG